MSCPWQLYVFSILNLAGGILCCFSTFVGSWIFGSTAPVECVMLRCFAICMLFVGVLFSVLTYVNHGNAEKLKRLAMVATQCTVAMFAGIIMAGPLHLGGVEKGWAHLGDMISMAVLLIIMWTAIADDKEVVGCSGLFSGLGVNPKTLLWLCLIEAVVEMFLITDFMSYHYFDPDASSEMARVLWNFMGVFCLEVVLALFFAIGYGDYKDQEVTVIAYAVLVIVSGLALLGTDAFGQFLRTWIICLVVFIILTIVAVVGGRREGRSSSGYTPVGNV